MPLASYICFTSIFIISLFSNPGMLACLNRCRPVPTCANHPNLIIGPLWPGRSRNDDPDSLEGIRARQQAAPWLKKL